MKSVNEDFEEQWMEGNFPGWPVCKSSYIDAYFCILFHSLSFYIYLTVERGIRRSNTHRGSFGSLGILFMGGLFVLCEKCCFIVGEGDVLLRCMKGFILNLIWD